MSFGFGRGEPERHTYDFSTVDDLVQKLKLTRLDCIKIDVDSFDFEVLMGAEETLRRFNSWIVVELCHSLSRRDQSVTKRSSGSTRRISQELTSSNTTILFCIAIHPRTGMPTVSKACF